MSEIQKYFEMLPTSRNIYTKLFGEIKSHSQWADSFNKIGDINKELIKIKYASNSTTSI